MPLFPFPYLLIFVVSVLISSLALSTWRTSKQRPLPPGPPKLPIIGNLHQAPAKWAWRTYRDWAKRYGPLMSVQYGKDTLVILSTHELATDLLDKRGAIYSSRPRLVMAGEVVSHGYRFVLIPYGQQFRTQNHIIRTLLAPKLSKSYTPIQDLESTQLMHELLSVEEDAWMERLHRFSASLIFALNYGKRIPRGDEPELGDVKRVIDDFLYAARIGAWVVDALPALNYLPSALAPWKRIGNKIHQFESTFFMKLAKEAKGMGSWNWSAEAADMKVSRELSEKELSYILGTLYEAGSDTTTTALQSFVLACLLYPEAMQIAREELDNVLGNTYPTFEHQGSLPAVNAVITEVLRWRIVNPGGIPHAVTEDDEYMGYHIPKGAIIIPNLWAMNLDEHVYGRDALEFRPNRWLEDPALPPPAIFGWSRRRCPGQIVASNSLFINIARILWAFNILPATNEHGAPELPDPMAYTDGFIAAPLPFKARFVLRSEDKREPIERAWREQPKDVDVLLQKIGQANSRS